MPSKFRRILPKEQILPNKVTYVAPKIPFRRICPNTDHVISKRHEKPCNTRPAKGPTPCKNFPPTTARHVHSRPKSPNDHIAPSRVITVDTLKEFVRKKVCTISCHNLNLSILIRNNKTPQQIDFHTAPPVPLWLLLDTQGCPEMDMTMDIYLHSEYTITNQ